MSGKATQGERLSVIENNLRKLEGGVLSTQADLEKVRDEVMSVKGELGKLKSDVENQHSEVLLLLRSMKEDGEKDKIQRDAREGANNAEITAVQKQVDGWMGKLAQLRGESVHESATVLEVNKVAVVPAQENGNEAGPVIHDPKKGLQLFNKPKNQSHIQDVSTTFGGGRGNISVSDKMKIWQRKMTINMVSRAGDFNFPAAKQDFIRLHAKFQLSEDIEREMSMLAFENSALTVANGVCREYPDVATSVLWGVLESRLFNETQRRAQNATFLSMKWEEKKESVAKFGERVDVLGTSLGYGKDLVQATFIKGLPNRLQPYAYSTQGGFDELVAAMHHIAETQKRPEFVREMSEQGSAGPLQRNDGSTATNDGEVNRFRNRNKDRFVTYTCFRCNKVGHVSWQKEKCEAHKEEEDKQPGNGGGRGPNKENQG